MKKPLIILTGPTAVGKTELSIKLAKAIDGEIISADSMQVYKYMDIGSAKIKPEEIGAILNSGNRTAAGPTVPAGGLYMTHLWYDDGVENFECTPLKSL